MYCRIYEPFVFFLALYCCFDFHCLKLVYARFLSSNLSYDNTTYLRVFFKENPRMAGLKKIQ